MPPPLFLFLASSFALVAVFALGVFAGMTTEQHFSRARRKAWWAKKRLQARDRPRSRRTAAGTWEPAASLPLGQSDAADQLRTVMAADFSARPILNKGEARVFKALDQIVVSCDASWQVMAQVSLGEILRCRDAQAYRCINSKRVDLLLIDGECLPRHVIEYQGSAHFQGTAAARDAVKKEALRRAGVGYHEVVAGHTTPGDLRRLVERLIKVPEAAHATATE